MIQLNVTQTGKYLIGVIFAVFLVQQFSDQYFGIPFTATFGMIPASILHYKIWQFFTYSFLHASIGHLIFNLVGIVFFAGDIEVLWGRRRFLQYYCVCVLGGSFSYFICAALIGGQYPLIPLVGASGAVMGILVAYGILYSERDILLFGVFPLKAKHLVLGFVGYELLSTLFSGPSRAFSGVAHLGGMTFGFLYLWCAAYFKRSAKATASRIKKSKPKLTSKHLRLVPGPDADDDDDPKTWH